MDVCYIQRISLPVHSWMFHVRIWHDFRVWCDDAQVSGGPAPRRRGILIGWFEQRRRCDDGKVEQKSWCGRRLSARTCGSCYPTAPLALVSVATCVFVLYRGVRE